MSEAMVVTIGRNVDGAPMPEQDWIDFRDAVDHALWKVYRPTIYFSGLGTGKSPEWGHEQAATFVVEAPASGKVLAEVELALERVRAVYHQEAVAVTIGRTFFV